MTNQDSMSDQDIVELEIIDVAYGGDGVGRLDSGLTVFVPFTAVGDRLRARIVQRKKSFARAELVDLLTPGTGRTQPACPYYSACGGCQYQHLTQETELAYKTSQLAETFRRLGPLEKLPEIQPVVAHEPYGYRRKIVLHPTADSQAYGYYRHDNETVIPIEACPIAAEPIQREIAKLSASDVRPSPFTMRLADNGRVYHYHGRGPQGRTPWLRDHLQGQKLHVPLASFSQVNESVSDALVVWLRQRLGDRHHQLLVDLYCGAGMFALALAGQAEQVIGIERDRESIRAAAYNARKWDCKHVDFRRGNVEKLLPRLVANHPQGDDVMVILDPPRTGCEKTVMRTIADWAPEHLLYISCNPTTQARDLKRLCNQTPYRLDQLALFDMFPRTAHFESVALLQRT